MNEPTQTGFANPEEGQEQPAWRPLESIQRRVLGVLIEKAKTTPDSYPMTLNSVVTACNQKSNRKPQMTLDGEDVSDALDQLREMGAATEVQGDGRVAKFRHKAYQWLGVDKVELAVIAELLLRGEQTLGELRSRAARMEPIDGLAVLKPVLAGLKQRGLLIELTPEGRGQIVTHGLYPDGHQPTPTPFSEPSSAAPARETASSRPGADQTEFEELKRVVQDLLVRIEALEQSQN